MRRLWHAALMVLAPTLMSAVVSAAATAPAEQQQRGFGDEMQGRIVMLDPGP